MAKMTYHEYWPYNVTPPGVTLLGTIEHYDMSEAELASAIGTTPQVVHDLINGQALLTPKIAEELEKLFGVSARFWNERERRYRVSVARQEAEGPFEGLVGWLDEVPVAEMVGLDWIDEFEEDDGPVDQLIDVLNFFRVPSPGEWRKEWAYLKPQADALSTNLVALSAWVRQGEWATREIDCEPYDQRCFRQTLHQVRALTDQPLEAVFEQVVALCARSGVAVGMIRTLSGMNVGGVTRWLAPERALIQLAPSHTPLDLWSRFFHQAAHILLHEENEYFEGRYTGNLTQEELEANQFAGQMLHLGGVYRTLQIAPTVNGPVRTKERMATEKHRSLAKPFAP
ncbi:MAG: XRE family transcriptional regulator [Ardenticatenaceae bacterium]